MNGAEKRKDGKGKGTKVGEGGVREAVRTGRSPTVGEKVEKGKVQEV